MPKKSRGKAGKDGEESGATKTKSKKMSKFDMLKAEHVGDAETEETEQSTQEVKKTKKSKKIVGDPGYRPKDEDEDLEVCSVIIVIHSFIRVATAQGKRTLVIKFSRCRIL